MEAEHRAEWVQLQTNALSRLRAGSWTLLLCREPSFADPMCVGAPSGAVGVVMARVWERDLDAGKFRNPIERLKHPRSLQPTVREWSTRDTEGLCDSAIRQLEHIPVPCAAECRSVVLDGTSYRIEASSGTWSASYSWVNEGPAPWRRLTEFFSATWSTLFRLVSETPTSTILASPSQPHRELP